MEYLGLCLMVGMGAMFVQRACWKWRRVKGKSKLGFYPTGASLGNALQVLQAFAEPKVRHVLAEKLDESEDEDDEAGPKDPTAHLMRQARRIRNGRGLDRLTALLPP